MNLEIYLQEIMRNVAASLMIPVMIVLVCLILFAVYSVGAIIAEFFIERRHFKANMPRDIKAIKDAEYVDLPATIEGTGLLRRQKEALQVVVANMGLPEDDLFALAKAEVSATDARYRRKVARNDLVTKIAPMMGLMCTLIPLGPGIVAMGQGEVNLLSNSLLVAFDGTVAGLIGGVVSMVVASIRKRWYANYLVAMESLTTCILEKAAQARRDGVELPYEGDIRAKAEAMRADAGKPVKSKRASQGARQSREMPEPRQEQAVQQSKQAQAAIVAQQERASLQTQTTPLTQQVQPMQQAQAARQTQTMPTMQQAQAASQARPMQQAQDTLQAQPLQQTQAVSQAQPIQQTQSTQQVQPAQQARLTQSSFASQPNQSVRSTQTMQQAYPVQFAQPVSQTGLSVDQPAQAANPFQPIQQTTALQSDPALCRRQYAPQAQQVTQAVAASAKTIGLQDLDQLTIYPMSTRGSQVPAEHASTTQVKGGRQ